MSDAITFVVDHTIVPVANSIPWMVEHWVLFAVFAALWVAFGVGLVMNQGGLDAAWQWLRGLPIYLQAVVWLLFLPVTAGLWVWETTWPEIVRIVVVLGIAGWNLLVFIPRAAEG
jgi:hypothetical protein